jgi:predicted lipoprotein
VPPAPSEAPQQRALERTVEQVVVPTYRELSERTSALAELLSALGPGASAQDLAVVREAYREARAPLEEADAFAFGPAVQLNASSLLDHFPIDPAQIEAQLAGSAELTASSFLSLRPSARGLHAVEYLLFPEHDLAREAALLQDSVAGARRRQYLSLAGTLVAQSARELYAAWARGQGEYGRRFAQPGQRDSVLATAQAGIDMLLMESVFLSEHVADTELGRPRRRPVKVEAAAPERESERAGMALADVRASLRGMQNVYRGARDDLPGASISGLVHSRQPSADARVKAAFEAAELAIAELPEDADAKADAQAVERAFAALKNLKHLMGTELLTALGSSLAIDLRDGD